MKRFAIAALWTSVFTFVFLILFCFAAGVMSVIMLEGTEAENHAAIDEASRQWALPIFFGSMLAGVGVSSLGLLPGTRRRPAVATEAGELAESEFPAAQPTIVLPVGALDDPPPELAALGPPLSVHAPGWPASMSGFGRLVTFVLGLVLFIAPFAVIDTVGKDQLPEEARKILLIGGIVAGLVGLVIALLSRSPYTYRVYEDALVVCYRKNIRIVFWD